MDDQTSKPFRGTPGKRPDGRTAPCLDYECSECGHHVHRRSPPLGWAIRTQTYGTARWLCPTCIDTLTKEKADE